MNDVGSAIGRIPSGIFILTARRDGDTTGMLASWVMQASFEPPIVTAAVRSDRYLCEWLKEGARAAVNILSDDEKSLISHFGRGFKPDEEAFEGLQVLSSGTDAPILADVHAFVEGPVVGNLTTGDHVVFAIQCDNGRVLSDGTPMTHIRKDGMTY